MRVRVDSGACVSSGQCALTAPEVFDQGEDDGVVVLLQPLPPAQAHDAVREAATRCPARAISLE